MIDRDDLRTTILRNNDDLLHLPVNIPRILWNAKENFNIKEHSKTDLHPEYVLDQLAILMGDLTAMPGV